VVVGGASDQVAAGRELITTIDVDLGIETRIYRPTYVAPERLDTLARQLVDPAAVDRVFRSSVDSDGAFLVVSTTPELHRTVEQLLEQLDVPVTATADPVQFYKLQNADAADVLETIRAIEGADGLGRVDAGGLGAPGDAAAPERSGQIDGPGPADAAAEPGDEVAPFYGSGGGVSPRDERASSATIEGREVTVTADETLNAIIVVAEPAVQRIYASLIQQLDRRRPQVMIEATVVTLDTTDGFTLGVEISTGDREDSQQTFTLSAFGINQVDGDNGLSVLPGLGLNGAVLVPEIADVVIQALKSDGRTEVVAAPKVLVNDNATGTISSVAQAPVQSINQGQNSDTVTFSGFVDAGTTITVTPHIAEGDHLRLEFEVALESFTGDAGGGLPPPRSSNTVTSEVTIPDGATIVVGGINRRDYSESVSRIPILGELPVLEYLFSSRTTSETESTLFVFLRPVILRDDKFADLKHYAKPDVAAAGLKPDYPVSGPRMIR